MADFSSLTGKFKASKDGLHDSSAGRVVKRPRESLVCNQCRKSKLRCNRGQPCGSCVKRDTAAACNYQRSAGPNLDNGRHTPAEDRLLHLESMIRQLIQNQTSTQSNNDSESQRPVTPSKSPQDQGGAIDYPRSESADEIRYVGSTHWSAILDDIHELKVVLGGPVDVQETEQPIIPEPPTSNDELIFGSPNNYSLQEIISEYLPSKVEADRSLSIYFQGEAFIVPFVHTYDFQRQYQIFWANTENANPLWLSILFSICYLASLIGGSTNSYRSSQNDSATGCIAFHTAAGKCLVLGKYHLPQKFSVEALVLYAQCKNLRSLDPSREAGAVLGIAVRIAYEMGYHRDPDSFRRFTAFEGEMRRRTWAACKQMNLMLSFQLGLPSNICFENSDTKSPRNLPDSDFNANTQVLPVSRSENEATKILWFIVKDRLMPGFAKVWQDVLSFKEKSEADILELDKEIRQMHTTIPDVLRTRPLSESIVDPPLLIMTRIYVEFIHLKSLCALHRRYMARGDTFSTASCIEAGTKLVSQFLDVYKEFSPGGQLHGERWMLSNFTMNDFMLGVMVLCLVVHICRKRGSQNSTIDSITESNVLALLEQSHIICVEKSTASRDARRVSHAISLTLNKTNSSNTPQSTVSRSQPTLATPSSNTSPASNEAQFVDLTMLSLEPQSDYMQGDEAAFGTLDPFNFMSNGIDDFTMFDQQKWGQNGLYLNFMME